MGQLLDEDLELLQILSHAGSLLLTGQVLLGTMLGWEAGNFLVTEILLPRVWKRGLRANQCCLTQRDGMMAHSTNTHVSLAEAMCCLIGRANDSQIQTVQL